MIVTTHFVKPVLLLAIFALISACAERPVEEEKPVPSPPPLVKSTAESSAAAKKPLVLRPGHPQRYTVKPGDTLLDVAKVFLEKPWQWPDIWRSDPKLANSNAIYAGEVVELYEEGGQPRLRVVKPKEPPTLKLSPQVRALALERPIPTVPRSAIEAFLLRSKVLTKAEWSAAPAIIGSTDERFALSAGNRVYVKGLPEFDQRTYQVFRPGRDYRDPKTGESLGFDGLFVADARGEQEGNPSTLVLISNRREVLRGDRVFPFEEDTEVYTFSPHAAPPDSNGQILSLIGESINAALNQSVVVNLGEDDGMNPGMMLEVRSNPQDVRDPFNASTVHIPGTKSGTIMLYKIYPRLSYGLVTSMVSPIHVLDRVTEPDRVEP